MSEIIQSSLLTSIQSKFLQLPLLVSIRSGILQSFLLVSLQNKILLSSLLMSLWNIFLRRLYKDIPTVTPTLSKLEMFERKGKGERICRESLSSKIQPRIEI